MSHFICCKSLTDVNIEGTPEINLNAFADTPVENEFGHNAYNSI